MDSDIVIFLKKLVDELTDFDVETISNDTTIEELDLVSLDFVTIKVEAKKQLGIDIDLNSLAESDLFTFGELVDYLERNRQEVK
jgi:acyl carrier protein